SALPPNRITSSAAWTPPQSHRVIVIPSNQERGAITGSPAVSLPFLSRLPNYNRMPSHVTHERSRPVRANGPAPLVTDELRQRPDESTNTAFDRCCGFAGGS